MYHSAVFVHFCTFFHVGMVYATYTGMKATGHRRQERKQDTTWLVPAGTWAGMTPRQQRRSERSARRLGLSSNDLKLAKVLKTNNDDRDQFSILQNGAGVARVADLRISRMGVRDF